MINRRWIRLMMRQIMNISLCILLGTGSSVFSFTWKLFPNKTGVAGTSNSAVFDFFFDEHPAHDGFLYAYPANSSVTIIPGNAHRGNYALEFNLDSDDYSGGAVCLGTTVYDIQTLYDKGALQFWLKGASGGEKAFVSLVDEENEDGKKTVVRLELNWFGTVTTDWTFFSIPLEKFGTNGVYWDQENRREVENRFDWGGVAEFRIEVKMGENSVFRIWVDDIVIVKTLR